MRCLLMFICIFYCFESFAENLNQEVIEAQHQQLRELKEVYENAVSNNQLDQLLPLIDDEFSFVTFTDSLFDIKTQSFEKFKKDWDETRNKMLLGGSYNVVLDPERSIIIGEIAIAKGIAHHKIRKGDGTNYEFPGQWTAVLQQKDNKWKVIRAHSSISAFENPIIEDYVKALVIKVGLFSGLLGVIIGLFGFYFWNRRSRQA